MKCFENYFEKNNYKISNICMRIISRRIPTKYQIYLRVKYMRGVECFIQEGHVLG